MGLLLTSRKCNGWLSIAIARITLRIRGVADSLGERLRLARLQSFSGYVVFRIEDLQLSYLASEIQCNPPCSLMSLPDTTLNAAVTTFIQANSISDYSLR